MHRSGVGVKGFRLVTQRVECLLCVRVLSLVSPISGGEADTECGSQMTVLSREVVLFLQAGNTGASWERTGGRVVLPTSTKPPSRASCSPAPTYHVLQLKPAGWLPVARWPAQTCASSQALPCPGPTPQKWPSVDRETPPWARGMRMLLTGSSTHTAC